MGSLDLRGVEAKYKWANVHFEAVNREISAWLNSDQNSIIVQNNEDFTQWYLQASMKGDRPDFERWGLMIGDCVTNLRDSLDHLVYGIAHLANSPKPEKSDKAAFIIRDKPESFALDSKTRLCSVPKPIFDAVLSFQPFNRPHLYMPPLLGLLNEFANGSKHKLLNVVLTTPAIVQSNFISSSGKRQKGQSGINRRDIEDGTTILVFEIPEPDPTIYLDMETAILYFEVALKHSPKEGRDDFGADRTPQRILLQWIFAEVRSAIDTLAGLV